MHFHFILMLLLQELSCCVFFVKMRAISNLLPLKFMHLYTKIMIIHFFLWGNRHWPFVFCPNVAVLAKKKFYTHSRLKASVSRLIHKWTTLQNLANSFCGTLFLHLQEFNTILWENHPVQVNFVSFLQERLCSLKDAASSFL